MSPGVRSVADVTDQSTSATTIRNVPEALLLDFGGVLFQTAKDPDGKRLLAERLAERMRRGHIDVPVDELERSLSAGLTALKHWKHAQSRRPKPAELAPRDIIREFLASDLPRAARELLAAEAGEVLAEVTTVLSRHELRPGIRELLDLADERGIPVGIVSNAHSGRSHRRVLAEHHLDGRFVVQCYSDEVGIRKPHPGIIALAAEACGTTPERCWYVGDTQDRDVVAGRRAGVGAVIVTRSHHTDTPPFAVAHTADAVFDTPEGLVAALRDAGGDTTLRDAALRDATDDARTTPGGRASTAPDRGPDRVLAPRPADDTRSGRRALDTENSRLSEPVAASSRGAWAGDAVSAQVTAAARRALLIDHGGVISMSTPDPELLRTFCEWLAELLGRHARPDDVALAADDVARLIAAARERHAEFKRERHRAHLDLDEPLAEIDPVEFWRDWVGGELTPRRRAVLAAEAHDIMARYGLAKSRRRLRRGVLDLFEACHAARIPIVVVSNTISGHAVRVSCRDHGVDHLVAAYVCSDEAGVRKPDAALIDEALRIADADPRQTTFLGDKPQNDAVAARRAGVAARVLVRGGSTDDGALDDAVASGLATHLVDEPGDLLPLFAAVPTL